METEQAGGVITIEVKTPTGVLEIPGKHSPTKVNVPCEQLKMRAWSEPNTEGWIDYVCPECGCDHRHEMGIETGDHVRKMVGL